MPLLVLTLRQLAKCLLLILAVSFLAFALVSAAPIDPMQANLGQSAYLSLTEAERAQLAAYWGTDQPLPLRYLGWLAALLQGDMGTSLRFNAPVSQVIAERAGASLLLMAIAWVLSGVIGFALGIVAGMNRDRLADRLVKGYCFVLASVPTFWLALLALMVFAVGLGWFPFGFSIPVGVDASSITWTDRIHHAILPALVLAFVGVANIALHTREKIIDIMNGPFARYARAQGKSRLRILAQHGLRNASLPAITLQFASLSEIFGGSVLVEQVFSYPGLGQAAVTAGLGGDSALLAGIAVVSSVIVFSGNFIANVLYGVIDPRIRRGEVAARGGESPAA
ncbi:MAG TPA: ABC transporter permease [Candidatus Aphodovivens avistercoris]|nr:ABC transporter permease [Candidatus Aphodovivens avistercoris]